jgi:SOS response associated peptidase (SRAP)
VDRGVWNKIGTNTSRSQGTFTPLTLAFLLARGERVRWLVLFWAKEMPKFTLFDVRSEDADSKPAFRDSFKVKRCLIPADGFYEWQKGADGEKTLAHPSAGAPVTFLRRSVSLLPSSRRYQLHDPDQGRAGADEAVARSPADHP